MMSFLDISLSKQVLSQKGFTLSQQMFFWTLCVLVLFAGLSPIMLAEALADAAPVTRLHYAPNHNFGPDGHYVLGALGFNLADLNTVEQLDALPPGTQGLVWVGQCDGVSPAFLQKVQPFVGHAKLFGFYLMDNPDPRGRLTEGGYAPACTPEHLKAESDWVHANLTGAKTFMILMNLGTAKNPRFSAQYAPDVIHLDLYGIDPYPCRTEMHGCAYDMINQYVDKAETAGIPRSRMVPVYQVFGGGNYNDDFSGKYTLPTREQEQQMMARWGGLLAAPAFDYVYSWGSQQNDVALENASGLRPIFAEHNKSPDLNASNAAANHVPGCQMVADPAAEQGAKSTKHGDHATERMPACTTTTGGINAGRPAFGEH